MKPFLDMSIEEQIHYSHEMAINVVEALFNKSEDTAFVGSTLFYAVTLYAKFIGTNKQQFLEMCDSMANVHDLDNKETKPMDDNVE